MSTGGEAGGIGGRFGPVLKASCEEAMRTTAFHAIFTPPTQKRCVAVTRREPPSLLATMLPLYAAWRGLKPIDGGPQERCEQIQMSHYAPALPPYTQCLRPYSDKLSDRVRLEKRWMDCDALLGLWHSTTHLGGVKSSQSQRKPLFVDAGANIGSCKTQCDSNHALPRWPRAPTCSTLATRPCLP